MNAVLVEAGEKWLVPFERIARIEEHGGLQPFAVRVDELDGLLPLDDGLVPVWRPREFHGTGHVVVVYYGSDELGGLHVNQVLGLRQVPPVGAKHGDSLEIGGIEARWFDFDVLERRVAGLLPEE